MWEGGCMSECMGIVGRAGRVRVPVQAEHVHMQNLCSKRDIVPGERNPSRDK